MEDSDGAVARVLRRQDGVISRRQALEAGLAAHDIRRHVRRNDWARVHAAVYVAHTGPLTWRQRAWAAVLACAPAALCHESARRAVDGPGRLGHADDRPVHVAIDAKRVVRGPDRVVVHRLADLDSKVLWHTAPPRQRIEQAVLDLAAAAERDVDAVAFIADAVQAHQTTASRLATALRGRTRIARRDFLEAVIADVATGTCSVLEHGYLVHVERPHGLPTAHRQFAESPKGPLHRDAVYEEQGTIIELDGRLHHSSVRSRDRDLERDLDAVVTDRVTARLGWGQVFDRSCTTAAKVGRALQRRGWSGELRRCVQCPADA